MIILGTGCVGKTTLARKFENCIDLESIDFRWIYNDEAKMLSEEQRKGRSDLRTQNPAWPENYFEAIRNADSPDKIITAGIYDDVRVRMEAAGLKYWMVCFDNDLLTDLVKRTISRGNIQAYTDNAANVMTRHNLIAKTHINQICLKRETPFLENALLDMGVELVKAPEM